MMNNNTSRFISKVHLLRLVLTAVVIVTGLLLSSCKLDLPGSNPPPNTPSYRVSVTVSGNGNVGSTPTGISCNSSCVSEFTQGKRLTLTPDPDAGNKFVEWTGACSGSGGCTITVNANLGVGATFAPAPSGTQQLIVINTGGGTVASDIPGINCGADCIESLNDGTAVTLTASPAPDYTFIGWSGACSGVGNCHLTMDQERIMVAHFASTTSADLCDGLITDTNAHPMTALAMPALGHATIDPQFGTTIRRISDAGGTAIIKPAYSTIPAWNADESYLILYHTGTGVPGGTGHHLYNGKTYQYIKKLNINPPDLEQFYWHATDPNILYYVDRSNKSLTRYFVSTDTKEVVRDFSSVCPSGSISGGSDPMYMSWDTDVIGLRCSSGFGFAYRISADTVGTPLATTVRRAPIASASGTLLFLANGGGSAEVYDFNMNFVRNLSDIANPLDHASLGRLAKGEDTHNSVAFDGAAGSLVTVNMNDGSYRVIVGPSKGYPYPPSGHHISAVALKRPGWVAVSIVGNTNGQSVLNNELLLANTNPGGKVCRVGHHRSHGKDGPRDYWAEPHVVISPSGTRLLFGSDWGGGEAVNAYVVELPSYQP
jgi:hypothetical protein